MSCAPQVVREAEDVVAQADSLWHEGYVDAVTPSERYDLPFKNNVTLQYPGIQLLILHNYGAPVKY